MATDTDGKLTLRTRWRKLFTDTDIAYLFGIGVVIMIAFWNTATPYLLGGDAGEFSLLSASAGAAHPPGYPLYLIWLRAMNWLPGATPALRAARATGLLGALTALIFFRACCGWGASHRAAATATLLLMLSPLTWRLATQPEVFVLNVLLAGCLLCAAAWSREPTKADLRCLLIALLAGLSLCNHHSIAFLLPLFLYAYFSQLWVARHKTRTFFLSLATFAVGLGCYLTLKDGGQVGQSGWGKLASFSDLARHFLRADYGTFRLAISRAQVAPIKQLYFLASNIFGQSLFLLPLAVVGGTLLWRERNRRIACLCLVSALILAGPLFVSRFNIELAGVGPLVVERFHLLPWFVVAILIAIGLDGLVERSPRHRLWWGLILALVIGAQTMRSLPVVLEEHRPALQWSISDALSWLPANAVVMGTGDHRTFGYPYVQAGLQHRPDVTFVDPGLLPHAWYRERAAAKLGFEPVADEASPLDTLRLIRDTLQTGRPLFLTNVFAPQIVRIFPSYSIGNLVRILPVAEKLPDLFALDRMNQEVFAGYHYDGPVVRNTWAAEGRAGYERPWLYLADFYVRMGLFERAWQCQMEALRWRPVMAFD